MCGIDVAKPPINDAFSLLAFAFNAAKLRDLSGRVLHRELRSPCLSGASRSAPAGHSLTWPEEANPGETPGGQESILPVRPWRARLLH